MVATEFSPRHRITCIAIIFLPGMCDLSFNSSCSCAESLYRQLVRVHTVVGLAFRYGITNLISWQSY